MTSDPTSVISWTQIRIANCVEDVQDEACSQLEETSKHMAALSQRSGARTNRQLQENPVSLAIVYRPIERLQLSEDNPRFHTEEQILQVARELAAGEAASA
jgi:hypothetical protein